jgi:hypothetical protein
MEILGDWREGEAGLGGRRIHAQNFGASLGHQARGVSGYQWAEVQHANGTGRYSAY